MCISQETLGDTVHLGEERRRLWGKTKASQFIGGVNKKRVKTISTQDTAFKNV